MHILQPFDGTTFVTIGMQAMVDAIRATGAKQPIIISGREFANDLSGWLDNRPNDSQLIAGWHNYNHQPCNTEACWNATVAPVAAQVPVVSGEFAENDCKAAFDKAFMNWADERGDRLHAVGVVDPAGQGVLAAGAPANVRGDARKPNGTALKATWRSWRRA